MTVLGLVLFYLYTLVSDVTDVCLCAVGRSLLWVAVLGFVLFYLYALISFAFLRASFDPESDMYCGSLWQCTVTVIRYGLIGDIFEVRLAVSPHCRCCTVVVSLTAAWCCIT